jgi:hypothetical protein
VFSSHMIRCFSAMLGAYFFLQSLAQRSWGRLSHLHQILALRTLFRVVGSHSLRPPFNFGLQSFSQLIRAIFHPVFSPCQRKFLCKVLMAVKNEARCRQGQERVDGKGLQDKFKEDEVIGKVEREKSLRGKSFSQGSEKSFPRVVSEEICL